MASILGYFSTVSIAWSRFYGLGLMIFFYRLGSMVLFPWHRQAVQPSIIFGDTGDERCVERLRRNKSKIFSRPILLSTTTMMMPTTMMMMTATAMMMMATRRLAGKGSSYGRRRLLPVHMHFFDIWLMRLVAASVASRPCSSSIIIIISSCCSSSSRGSSGDRISSCIAVLSLTAPCSCHVGDRIDPQSCDFENKSGLNLTHTHIYTHRN